MEVLLLYFQDDDIDAKYDNIKINERKGHSRAFNMVFFHPVSTMI